MYLLTVNGALASSERDGSLISFLRGLGLTSVKNGCSEGACGACTVIVDGRASRACVLKLSKTDGSEVVTCEGLTEREREAYSYAFGSCGAVQCGFCTPGMVMSAKALIDKSPDPSLAEVRRAIRGNICRCTGYKKIEAAILLAARILREGLPVPKDRFFRIDASAKTLGMAKYADDVALPDMLFGSAVRSEHPRARIASIDADEARAVPGVVCVLTADDIPGARKIGHIKKDYDVMIPVGAVTHFRGDAVALVAAETREALERAKRLVRVEYEVLPPVLSLEDAMRGSIAVHEETDGNLLSGQTLKRGDADAAIAASAHVVTRVYKTAPSEHAFLEPECAVALPDGDGILIYSGDQGIYQTRRECAECLGLPEDKVRVVAMSVGGGFGGKEDMSVQHHAALLAYKTRRPVKVLFSREESMLVHPKRHGMEIEYTTACDEEGRLTAVRARILTDSGAYASLGAPVLQRACTHAAGPYRVPAVDIEGRAYYSNNPPCGAFRGFGVPQSCFAAESNLDLLAEKAGLTPFEIRYKNAVRPGDCLPNGQIVGDDAAIIRTLDAVRPYLERYPDAGIACALKNSGLGVGVPDVGRVRLIVSDGRVRVRSSAACIGQGLGSVLTAIVRSTAGLSCESVVYDVPDTSCCPDSGNTTASRQTLFTGEAARIAASELGRALEGTTLQKLEGREFFGEFAGLTDPMDSDAEHPVSHVAYSYATQLAALGEDGRVELVAAAHDVGRAVDPISVEGQIEGGVTMSLGWALTERFPLSDGAPRVKFGTLGLLRAENVPEIRPIIVEAPGTQLAMGAKGIGEIASIPTAPAVALAYYHRDGELRTELPLKNTPYLRNR